MASKVFLIACILALSLETVLAANMACVNLKDSFMAKGVEAADLVRSPVKGKSRNLGSVRFHILTSFFRVSGSRRGRGKHEVAREIFVSGSQLKLDR